MKILIIRTFPSIMNFKQYNVQEIGLAKALVRKGHECGIVFYNGKNRDEIEYVPVSCDGEVRNITVYKLHGYNILKNGFFPSLKKITKEYDVLQVHEYDQITSWLYYAWSKKPVVIYHGPYYHEFNKGYNFKCKIFDNVFLRIKSNKKVPCMTKSPEAARFLESKGFSNVEVVGVGLDDESFVSGIQPDEDKREENQKFRLIYVGKIEERRNSLFLADVVNRVLELYQDVECLIIGDGLKEYTIEFLAKMQYFIDRGRVTYIPKASQKQIAEYYQNTSLMIFPSSYEIFGMVLAEAIYFELPVISTSNGGANALLINNENGIIIDKLDVDIWVENIRKCIENEAFYRNLKDNLKAFDKKNLSWDYVAIKMDKIYKNYERETYERST